MLDTTHAAWKYPEICLLLRYDIALILSTSKTPFSLSRETKKAIIELPLTKGFDTSHGYLPVHDVSHFLEKQRKQFYMHDIKCQYVKLPNE